MVPLRLIVRTATTFSPDGPFDEEAFRAYLQRFVDTRLDVYLASGGSGEGFTLTMDELGRVYQSGVNVCQGKVLIGSNQPEQHTPAAAIEHAQLAIEAGVDVVQIYGPASWHGYQATNQEYTAYFEEVLSAISYPVALCPNPTVQSASPYVIAALCDRYPQVSAVNLTGIHADVYCGTLVDTLKRDDLQINVDWPSSASTLMLGATGVHAAEANFTPRTFRRYLDLHDAGDVGPEIGKVYADLRRVTQFTRQWKLSPPRIHKMVMKAFRLPGWEGGVREPQLMPDDAEIDRFTRGALALGVPEINDMAAEAGLDVESLVPAVT
jgi:dihydrodipicolinate synthase/N-acetylneuraminate lyase